MNKISVAGVNVVTKDLLIAAFIISLPFLYYLFELVPEVKIWKTNLFIFDSKYYNDANVFAWVLMTKVYTVGILFFWYKTCKKWWRYAILVPIVVELFKTGTIVNSELYYVDEFEYFLSLPITIPLIFLVLFLCYKFLFYSKTKDLKAEFQKELDDIISDIANAKVSDYSRLREQFEELKKRKNKLTKEEYLRQLLTLKNEIIID